MTEPPSENLEAGEFAVRADALVLAIGELLKGGPIREEPMKQGITFCANLVSELSKSEVAAVSATESHVLRFLDQSFESRLQGAEFFSRAKQTLSKLLEGNETVSPEEIAELQRRLIQATMSAWRARHRDFQQRRLKRRLKRHA